MGKRIYLENPGAFCRSKAENAVVSAGKSDLFNGLYLPLILGYGELFFGGEISEWLRYSSVLAGQVIFALYDKAYDYVQLQIWGKIRNRLFSE